MLGLRDAPAQRLDLPVQLARPLARAQRPLAQALGIPLGLVGDLGRVRQRLLAPAPLGLRALRRRPGVADGVGQARAQLRALVVGLLEAKLELGQLALELGQRALGLLRAAGDRLLGQLRAPRAPLGQDGPVDDRRPRRRSLAGVSVPRPGELDLLVAHLQMHPRRQGRAHLLGTENVARKALGAPAARAETAEVSGRCSKRRSPATRTTP